MTPLSQLLHQYAPAGLHQETERERFQELLETAGDGAFDRNRFDPGHITASCWIVSPDGKSCLLTHHRKLGRWLQLGGHCDGDPNVIGAALREAEEESGLRGFTLASSGIYDLDIHIIPARKREPAHLHYDVRFALHAPIAGQLRISEESHDLAWVNIDKLADFTDEESVLRLARNWRLT